MSIDTETHAPGQPGTTVLPADVYVQLCRVRASGKVNMLDRRGVQHVANGASMYALVLWIEDHDAKAWGPLFFNGSSPDRELTDDERDAIAEVEERGQL